MRDTTVIRFKPISTYGFHQRLSEFLEAVESGRFIDDDGSGALATESQESNIDVWPSTIKDQLEDNPEYRGWATHIVWFNK